MDLTCIDEAVGLTSNVLRGYSPIVDSIVDQLVLGRSGGISDLELIGNFVPHLSNSPFLLGNRFSRDSPEVGRDFDEFCHISCSRLIRSLIRWEVLRLNLRSSEYLGAPSSSGSLQDRIVTLMVFKRPSETSCAT